jgi:uncharacterized protein (TIGR00288 family)
MAQKQRVAVLIDAENFSAKLANHLFGAIAKLGKSKVRRIYGNLKKRSLKGWIEASNQHHVEPREDAPHAKKKNVTDFTFIIDAMDLLHNNAFDGICIISRDSDFAGLARHIRAKGKRVYVVDDAHKTLRAYSTDIIELKSSAPATSARRLPS